MKSIKLILIILLSFHTCLFSQSTDKKLDKYFIKKMQKANLAGIQAAYISNGVLNWVGSYGDLNFSTKEKINDSTLFMIASCSKPVTALGLMKLYDQNKLDLDADINTYLPFKIRNPTHPEKGITTRMLLTHTSSLKDNMDVLLSLYTFEEGGDSPMSMEEFATEYFSKSGTYYDANLNFANSAPGESKVYCNAGYALAGFVIEQITGISFDEYFRNEVFKPLKMYSSYWYLEDIRHNNISLPHEYIADTNSNNKYKVLKHYGYPTVADGQLRTNVSDYSQIVRLMVNKGKVDGNTFLKESTIDAFLSVQFPETNKWQAISWNYNEFDNWIYYLLMPRLPSHTGVDPGVATVTSFDPDTKNGAIIFANTLTTSFKGHKILYQEMIKKLLKEARRAK